MKKQISVIKQNTLGKMHSYTKNELSSSENMKVKNESDGDFVINTDFSQGLSDDWSVANGTPDVVDVEGKKYLRLTDNDMVQCADITGLISDAGFYKISVEYMTSGGRTFGPYICTNVSYHDYIIETNPYTVPTRIEHVISITKRDINLYSDKITPILSAYFPELPSADEGNIYISRFSLEKVEATRVDTFENGIPDGWVTNPDLTYELVNVDDDNYLQVTAADGIVPVGDDYDHTPVLYLETSLAGKDDDTIYGTHLCAEVCTDNNGISTSLFVEKNTISYMYPPAIIQSELTNWEMFYATTDGLSLYMTNLASVEAPLKYGVSRKYSQNTEDNTGSLRIRKVITYEGVVYKKTII